MIDNREISEDEATFAKALMLFVSIASSPLLFAAVMWFLVGRAGPSELPGLVSWAVVGLFGVGGLVVWLLFHRRAVEPVTEWSRHRRRAEDVTAAMLQNRLVIAWAGAESVGFAGVIAYFFLGGNQAMLVTSLAASVLCFALSAPRREWYRTLQREAGAAEAG